MSWKVLKYEHPAIFVRNTVSRKDQEFRVSDDLTLESESSRFDLGPARRVAIEFLYRLRHRRAAAAA